MSWRDVLKRVGRCNLRKMFLKDVSSLRPCVAQVDIRQIANAISLRASPYRQKCWETKLQRNFTGHNAREKDERRTTNIQNWCTCLDAEPEEDIKELARCPERGRWIEL